jgi:hypothetical protein
MINVSLTVREAMWIISKIESYDTIYDKIVSGFEDALKIDNRCNVTITNGMDTNNRIHCIKAIRSITGMGLKDAKDWTDVIVGRYDECGRWVHGGECNTIKLPTNAAAEQLLRDLTSLGCEGFLS